MSSSAISLIITGVVALILSLSIFWGAKRGLKKTFFRFIWIMVTAIVLFFTVPMLSSWLNTFDLSNLNIDICGKVNKLSDIGINIVNSIEGGKDALQNSEAVTIFVENLPTMILNILLFVIMFWLAKALLWLVWAPIASGIFDKEERQLKKQKKEQKKLKKQNVGIDVPKQEDPYLINITKNKHRVWGGILGFVLGLLVCAVTFSPIVGLNAIYQTAYASVKTEDEFGNKVPYLDQAIDKETRGYIQSYEDSIGKKIFKYTGVEFFSNLMFGSLATVQVGQDKISLVNEVTTAAKVLKSIDSLTSFDEQNITQDSLERFILDVRTISADIDDSKIVYLIGNQVIPHFIDKFLEDSQLTIIDGDVLDQVIIEAYKDFSKQFDFGALKAQLLSVLDVATQLNNYNLLAPIFNEEIKDVNSAINIVGNNITNIDGLANTVVDGLYNISILQNEYPALINAGIQTMFNGLNLQYVDQEIEAQSLKDSLKTILNKVLYICRYYSRSNKLDFGENTTSAMSCAGEMLNTFKGNIISEQNFAELVDYAKNSINKALTNVVDLTSIIDSIKNVEDWKKELLALATPYKSVVKIINEKPSLDKIMTGELDDFIRNIGKGLDSAVIGQSVLINNQNVRVALEAFLNKIDTTALNEILNIEIESSTTLLQYVYNNIYNKTTQTSKIEDWENELRYNLDIVKAIYNINKDGFDINKLSSSDNNQLSQAGLAIDKAIEKTNLLVSGKAFSKIAKHYLNKVTFPTQVEEILNIVSSTTGKTILDTILTNIANGDNIINYQNEFSKIKNVLKVDFENSSFIELGSMLDNLLGSNILTKVSVINEVVVHYIDEETVSLEDGLKPALTLMKGNLKDVVSYAKEFEYINELLSVLDGAYESDKQKFATFGSQFNKMIDFDDALGVSSKLFTTHVINQFINYYFDEFVSNNLKNVSQEIKDIVNGVKNNLHLVKNYERELLNFLELADYVDGSAVDLNGDNVQDVRDIGKYLDDMRSDIITPSIIKSLIAFYIQEETKTLEKGLKNIVNDIVATVKSDITIISSYEKEFDLLLKLTDQIQSETLDLAKIGKIFDTLQNQSSIVSRSVLEKLIKYFFDDFVATNLSQQDKAELKEIVQQISNNISSIDNFEKEFGNLKLLFDNVNNLDDISQIGVTFDQICSSNSKLIKEDPNIHNLVAYFFDDYVAKNLDAQADKKLIDIINDVKQNIPSIESYKKEFDQLNLLLNNIDNEDITEIGALLDDIANANSKLIKKDPNMFDMVLYFFDKFIAEKLDSENDKELIEIIENIKQNVNQIESFEAEFGYLETLLNNVNTTDTKSIGILLDSIDAEGSKLIKKDPNMFDLVSYFFDKFIAEKLDSENNKDIIEIVKNIKANVSDIQSFEKEFGYLETLLNNINTTDTKSIGALLDGIAAEGSKLIKKDPNMFEMVAYFFDKFIAEKLDSESDKDLIEIVNNIKANVSDIQSFETEFNHLETLLNNTNTTDIKAMGVLLDGIAAEDSKLIKKDPNMFELVAYFFDKFIGEKLNTESDEDLITIVNGIKSNINNIGSFAKEFDYLDLLLNNVNNSDIKAIGVIFDKLITEGSKLILKDPNINALVSYFFDDYILNNLDAEEDAELIKIVNGVKANIPQVLNFEAEFGYLELLLDNINNSDKTTIGKILDQIIAAKSKLIKRNPNINALVSFFFDSYVANNLDSTQDANLIAVVNGIKTNIIYIQNFEKEFGILEDLFDVVKVTDLIEIGKFFDELQAKDSQLVKRNPNINALIAYYFDNYIKDNLDSTNDAGLIKIINNIKKNISAVESFEAEFGNLKILFENINETELVKIGTVLDELEQKNSNLIKRDPNINELVAYFFDEYISNNLDAEEDANLIAAIKGMKTNIPYVESFETEFGYIDALFNKVESSTKPEIGLYLDSLVENNSKLIKKDPNMFDIVTCLFDDYISSNLNPTTDAELIKIVNGIKNNVSLIDSFEKEFSNLDLLFNNIDNADKKQIGKIFDDLQNQNSKLIKRDPNINALVGYFFDEYISLNLDEVQDAKLIKIIKDLKQNISAVESFETEFGNLDLLFSNIDNSNLKEIGKIFDGLQINSKLIKRDPNINDLVSCFFDEYVSSNLDAENDANLIVAIKGMKTNIPSVESFEVEFGYIDTLFNKVESATKTEIGAYLDSLVANSSKLIKKDPNMFDIVSCLFDDFVKTNLDDAQDADLIEVINGLKQNITFIERFETEFSNLDLLFSKLDGSNKIAIGKTFDDLIANNSKLIKRDPNINSLVEYLFDEYIENNLNSTDDAGLIKVINGIKQNISAVESFEIEFGNLDLLFDKVSGASKTEIGKAFDQIISSNSKLIKENPNIYGLVEFFFDDYVNTNLNAESDAELIDAVENIKQNISLIQNYELEFSNLDSLFDALNIADVTLMGETLDNIKDNSKLISSQNLQQIVLYFFDKKTADYTTDYNSTVALMRSKVENCTEFESAFTELNTIMSYLNILTSLNSIENFKNNNSVGSMLDDMAQMSYVSDKSVAYSVANIVFTKFLNMIENDYSATAKNYLVSIMNNQTFSFETYNPSDDIDYAGSHADENYYFDLVNTIKNNLMFF